MDTPAAASAPLPLQIYSDSVTLRVSPFTVIMDFYVAGETESDHLARVRMSPEHAKAVHQMLGDAIAQWEKDSGSSIPATPVLPPEEESRLGGVTA